MSCPICELPEFVTNHWDFETLCLEMRCEACTADPDDLPRPDSHVETGDHDPGDWDIPF